MTESTEMTVSQQASVASVTGYQMPEFTVKEVITTPLLKMEVGVPVMVTILTAPYEGQQIEGQKFDGVPTMVRVRDLQDGQEKELMLKTVLKKELEDLQKRDKAKDLIGRSFVLCDAGIREGKDYRTYGITEIELA